MKTRIPRQQLNIEIARLISGRATCERGSNGCVITSIDHRIICTGYNGPLAKHPHCDDHCDLSKPCTRSIHAEANAIGFAAKKGLELEGSILYCTSMPCTDCAELIILAGISTIIYENDFREEGAIQLFNLSNVILLKYRDESKDN